MIPFRVGDKDRFGNVVLKCKGPVYLWRSPDWNYLVYLYVEDARGLNTHRRSREGAEDLFDSVCAMLK